MADLKFNQKQLFEKIFDRSGYVLDFTDRTFTEFFYDYKINIDEEKYHRYGRSKMKRLRAFWDIEINAIVGHVLEGLLEYAININEVNEDDRKLAKKYINRLQGKNDVKDMTNEEFLQKNYPKIDLSKLELDSAYEQVVKQRIDEIKIALTNNMPLSAIFLLGSTLEGLLLELAIKNPKIFNTAKAAPKTKVLKPLDFHSWTLNSLIDVAYEMDFLDLNVKKFSHDLKDFRNYIHPRQQLVENFKPNIQTAEISYKVLEAVIANLSNRNYNE